MIIMNFDLVGEFNDFEIYCRSGQLSVGLRAQLLQFWIANNAIDNVHDCWRRSFKVEFIVLSHQAKIVGASSVCIDRLQSGGPSYWFYRMFIEPGSRVHGLLNKVFHTTFANLAGSYSTETGAPVGVAFIAENPKFDRPGSTRALERSGLEKIGTDLRGKTVWRKNFPL